MAANRGVYDPRQFLHYPDKNPFSDAAQRRLDDLIQDFLYTGIAFANGASLEDITAEKRERRAELTQHVVTEITEQPPAVPAVGESVEVAGKEEEDGGEYGVFSRVDKGKARDEREGPGLQGLWSRTDHVESGKPLLGTIVDAVDDAISLLSDNDSGDPALDDGEDLYAEAYEHGDAFDEELDDADREESSDGSPDLGLAHSRLSSLEQEIIYIGDSDDEEHTSWKIFSDIEADPQSVREKLRGDQREQDADWGPEFDQETEWEGQHNVWDCKGEGQDEEDDGKEYDWHQTKGKESDDEDADFIVHDEDQEEGHDGFPHMNQVDTGHVARRFFIPASLGNPWTVSDTDTLPSGSTLPTSAAWGSQSSRVFELGREQTGEEAEGDVEESDKPPASFEPSEPMPHDLVPGLQDQDATETNERGPPPESELGQLTESLDPSLSVPADATKISFPHLPIRYPDVVVSEQATELTDRLPGTDLVNEDQPVEIQHEDLPEQTIVSGTDLAETSPAFLTSMISPELLPSIIKLPSPESLDAFNLAPSEFTGADLEAPHAVEAPESRSVVTNDAPSHNDAPAIAEEGLLLDGAISLPSTEPILHDAKEFLGHIPGHDGVRELMTHLGEGPLEALQSSHDTNGTDIAAELLSEPSPELQTAVSAEMSVSDTSHKAPVGSPFSTDGENEDSQSKGSTLLHPAVFDACEHLDTAPCSPKPTTATADLMGRDIETHSVASEDLHREEIEYQPIVTEVTSEYGEETQQIRHGGKGEEAGEVLTRNPGDVTFSDYVVYEVMSEDGRADSHEADQRGVEGAHVDISERVVSARLVSAVSVGSSTPPLSPTATVTNSSAADPSVATSDLSTFHPASLSVVTSTGSPPPIHVARRSPAPADIRRRPMSHVCVASDEESGNSDEETALPDPRLPPEPTHLRIPVGVVGRSLGDDKEERAESMKVEPPTPHVRSESEGSSLNGDIRGAPDAERIPLTLVASDAFSAGQSKTAELVTLDTALVNPIGRMTTDNADHAPVKADVESGPWEESTGELTYPDSSNDQNKEDGTGGTSVSFCAQRAATPGDDGDTRQPPSSLHETPKSSFEMSSPTVDGVQSTIGANEQDSSQPSLNDNLIPNTEVKPPDTIENGPRVDTNGHTGSKLNGEEAAEILPSTFDSSLQYSGIDGHEPIVNGHESPIKPEHNLRSSTKGKGKGKDKIVASRRKRSESPLPHTTTTVTSDGGPLSRKRSRTIDIAFTPSKQARLTRSTTARAVSNLSNGDATSTSAAPDDRSDVSVASSSSAVSRILRQMGSGSSSFTSLSSRSPSATSQLSPTNAEPSFSAMPPPIRPYVPHSHHVPASLVSKNIDQQRATPVSHPSPPVSPSPSTRIQSTSTHKTRASCTDHKISFPGPDGLLYFLVPRCSLLDPEVEKDVSIVDCGVATKEEVQRAVGDLEAAGLDPYVLGMIRQLAGVQLMREGQVGYLPKPGERIRSRRRHRRSKVLSHPQDVVTQVDPSGPSGTGFAPLAPFSLQSPPSPASSSGSSSLYATKTTGTGIHTREHVKGCATDRGAYEPSSGEEDDKAKMPTSPPPPRPSPDPICSSTTVVSRKRRLRIEDTAYRPDDDAMDTSTDTESVGTKKRSKGVVKRKRIEPSIEGEHLSAEPGRTPPKRPRKRKEFEASVKQDEPVDGASEPRRKKRKHKTVTPP